MVELSSIFRRWLRHDRIAFDTSFLIPLLEDERKEESVVTRLFRIVERRSLFLITSTVTLLEVLVHPHRAGEKEKAQRYYGYLTRAPFLKLAPVTPDIADRAAELRAKYGLKTPDAIHFATALVLEATLFLTRDREFRKQKEIEVGIL